MFLVSAGFGVALASLAPPDPIIEDMMSFNGSRSTANHAANTVANRLWRSIAEFVVGSPGGDWSESASGEDSELRRYSSFSFTADGAFFAPFWAIFDMWFTPAEIMELEGSSLLTPLFVWCYLLINLVLFVNVRAP